MRLNDDDIALVNAYNDCCGIVSDDLARDIYRAIGVSDDAIEWLLGWYGNEYVAAAVRVLRYGPYAGHTFMVLDEDGFDYYLDTTYMGMSEGEYNETYGTSIRDAAFEGVLVIDL